MKERRYVALFENRKYLLGFFNENGYFCKAYDIPELPTLCKSKDLTQELLEEIPNLRYVEGVYEYTIWNKTVTSYTKLTVPVYVKVFGEYELTLKTYTFEIPSEEMIKAAKIMCNTVESKMVNRLLELSIHILESKLAEGKGITFLRLSEMPYKSISDIVEVTDKKSLWYSDGNYVIGDPSMVTSMELNLYVPEILIPFVVGKGGRKVKDMARIMRVNIIHVLPLEQKPED